MNQIKTPNEDGVVILSNHGRVLVLSKLYHNLGTNASKDGGKIWIMNAITQQANQHTTQIT